MIRKGVRSRFFVPGLIGGIVVATGVFIAINSTTPDSTYFSPESFDLGYRLRSLETQARRVGTGIQSQQAPIPNNQPQQQTPAPNNLDISKEVDKLKQDFEDALEASKFREEHAKDSLDRAESYVMISTLLITAVATIFVIYSILVGWFNKEALENLERKATELERDTREVKSIASELNARWAGYDTEIKESKTQLQHLLDFINLSVDEVFGASFYEIVQRLVKVDAFSPADGQELQDRIYERASILSLHHPEKGERRRALYSLRGVGSAAAVPNILKVVNDREEDPEIRLLAQEVLATIRESNDPPDSPREPPEDPQEGE